MKRATITQTAGVLWGKLQCEYLIFWPVLRTLQDDYLIGRYWYHVDIIVGSHQILNQIVGIHAGDYVKPVCVYVESV